MPTQPDAARARSPLRAWIAAGMLASLLVVVGWVGLRSTRADDASPAAGTASSTRPSASAASGYTPHSATARPALRAPAGDAPVDPAEPPTSVTIPLPSRYGGGTPVASSTAELANRLQAVPAELADLAGEPGGELPPTVVARLEDAHARGAALGERLGLDPSGSELLAGRFTNQLVRVERELQRSPPGVRFEDVVEMVTRDTLEDLRRNLGDDVAQAAASDVRGLAPLRPRPSP